MATSLPFLGKKSGWNSMTVMDGIVILGKKSGPFLRGPGEAKKSGGKSTTFHRGGADKKWNGPFIMFYLFRTYWPIVSPHGSRMWGAFHVFCSDVLLYEVKSLPLYQSAVQLFELSHLSVLAIILNECSWAALHITILCCFAVFDRRFVGKWLHWSVQENMQHVWLT